MENKVLQKRRGLFNVCIFISVVEKRWPEAGAILQDSGYLLCALHPR